MQYRYALFVVFFLATGMTLSACERAATSDVSSWIQDSEYLARGVNNTTTNGKTIYQDEDEDNDGCSAINRLKGWC